KRTVLRIFRIHRGKIILFLNGCPSPLATICAATAVAALRRRRRCSLSAWAAALVASAAALERHLAGGWRRLARALPLLAAAPASGRPCKQQPRPRGCPLWPCSGQPPPAAWPQALPTSAGTAPVGANHARGRPHLLEAAPCNRPSRGWPTLHGGWPWLAAPPPCCLRCENAARMHRTILRDSISSHVV
ncbi:hypothetical protein BHE74_00059317, partial [Ensete ventricosum]